MGRHYSRADYFSKENIEKFPERLEIYIEYGRSHGWFDFVEEETVRESVKSGSLNKVHQELLSKYGKTYVIEDTGREKKIVGDRNAFSTELSIYRKYEISEDTGLLQEAKNALDKEAELVKKQQAKYDKWNAEDRTRLDVWENYGYDIKAIDGEYHAIKNGEDIIIERTDWDYSLKYPTGYQTAAATAANSDKVYIDGKEYNSISEASRETGLSCNTIANGLDDGKTHKGHVISSTGPTTQNYWQKREAITNRYVEKNILSADQQIQAVLKDTYVKCAKELNAFYDKLQDGYVPTKSELLRMEEYQAMCANMIEHFDAAALSEAEIVKDCLIDTSGFVLSGYSKEQVEAFAFTEFNGINYSQRIWNNTEVLEEKVKAAVGEAIITGKSYKEAARDLAELTTQGRNATERLIRTETARVYVKAEQQEYKDAGIEYVEVLVEPGACDECAALKGKKWKLYDAPELPVHPNCRCDLLPVI